MLGHDIVVIGASAGGVEALKQLVSSFPADLPAAVFIVLHISPHGTSVLPSILTRAGALRAVHPQDGQVIEKGRIYIAPPDQHLLIKEGYMTLVRGPRENGHRPAVDVLFRSAARFYANRVIGVVLTGALDDGTAGLLSIKSRGGICVCQDPEDALYSGMPQSAIELVGADYVAPIASMGELLVRLVHEPHPGEEMSVSEEMKKETEIPEGHPPLIVGEPSGFACPECGGGLWEINEGELIRFRCRIGHAYSSQTLLAGQADALEEAFWVALRALEENASLARRMAKRAFENQQMLTARRYEEQAHDTEERASLIRNVLLHNPLNNDLDMPSLTQAGQDGAGQLSQ